QWISVINTNLTNSKRIGYKETRVSFSAGEVSSTGSVQTSGKSSSISFPSASLEIGKTQILDYVQGNLTQTGQIGDFALNGRGYFVVEDKDGNRYATRDGQFNFDTEGYLVTAEGLRVLTTGMDYFRVPASENFAVNTQGESESLTLNENITTSTNPAMQNMLSVFNPAPGVSSLSQSIYGNRKLLVIDIPTESNLLYSKYGYTKFQLGPRIPITINNDFSETMDGINPYLIDETMGQYFKHDLKNGTVKMSSHNLAPPYENTYVQALVSSQQYGDVNAAVDFHVRELANNLAASTGEGPFGLTIGKKQVNSDDNGTAYFVGVIGNQLVIRQNGNILDNAGLGALPTDDWYATTLDPNKKFTLKVDAENGQIRGTLYQNGAIVGTVSHNANDYQGYMSIGTSKAISTLANGGPQDNIIDITNLNIVDHSAGNTKILQKNLGDDDDVIVMQQYVEESTSTLADTLPMLSTAQKMFGAVSKIISVYNSMTDDTNA
ncbi:flagellar hook-basal body complex protein, partial [bacterium]